MLLTIVVSVVVPITSSGFLKHERVFFPHLRKFTPAIPLLPPAAGGAATLGQTPERRLAIATAASVAWERLLRQPPVICILLRSTFYFSCCFTVQFKPRLHSFIETSAQELVLMVFSEIVDAEIFCN
ncbi:hypothetical protein L2E82_02220 [Cichorium intybus]|uniref:Uncharacterized protein n=1 Tax=Cichorium intybus TaxID=13427 RepID=A0ACB9H2M9_CICIN|nr:hypothetical protein L2E82_02220 [Cichorium intybus]